MFIAMNRFKVTLGREADFEEVWEKRESRLNELPGFKEFHLLRGPEKEDHKLYSTYTLWASKKAFEDWTESEQFRTAHANTGRTEGMFLGHPDFEGFEIIQSLSATQRETVDA